MELNGYGVAGFFIGFILVAAVNPDGTWLHGLGGAVMLGWIANAFGSK